MLGEILGDTYPNDLTTEAGEIVAKGPNIMKGYWNKPEATKESIDPEGWYHTGGCGAFRQRIPGYHGPYQTYDRLCRR